MSILLLSTKLYVPQRRLPSQQIALVPRPHLIEKLTAGSAGKLTLVAAPAGFGKSTLLSEWVGGMQSETAGRPTCCWLTLDESDNDPIRFWRYFIAALQASNPGLSANTPALLQSPEAPPLETILTILLNDLDAWPCEVKPQIVLVLEDYHVIVSPTIHNSLTFLLDHLPATLHLVITTRADPPLSLARLRARGELTEIRADDLRFTEAETAQFLNEHMGLQLALNEVRLLAARTEGWIAGLQLAALSMHGHEDKASFLGSFSGGHRYIFTYLVEEVLNQQSEEIQAFLLQTSILARLCGPLCDAVMSADESDAPQFDSFNSQAILARLNQANLFLMALDDLDEWYRYHQLFAEVLQHRLKQRRPEIISALHRRASHWYAGQDYLADAIHHALLAADLPYAAELIEEAWTTLWNQGAIATLFGWMQALLEDLPPDHALPGPLTLYISYAWGLALAGQIEAAEASLYHVEATLQPTNSETSAPAAPHTLVGRAAALRAMLAARRGDPVAAAHFAQRAVALIAADAAARKDAYYALGLARQQQGAFVEALQAFATASAVGADADDSFLAVAARYHEARIMMVQGNLHRAAATYREILATIARSGRQLPVVGLVHIGYGEVLYQWNDLAAAAHEVDIGLALSPSRDLAYTDGPLHRFSILARIRQAMGDQKGALGAVDLAKEAAQQTGIALDIERAAALEALICLRSGELTFARDWAEGYAQMRPQAARLAYLHEFETLVLMRVLLACDRVDEALALSVQWLPALESAQRQGSVIELCMLQALALGRAEQPERARAALAQALTLAEPEGYVRLFVDEGELLRTAISEFSVALGKQSGSGKPRSLLGYIDTLLGAFGDAESQLARPFTVTTAAIPLPQSPYPSPVEMLTERELDVLRLLAAGLSNAAIAEELVVTVGTVKTHLKHVYGKLAVGSRTQAVAQARTLGIL